jgi:hypothetical protein
MMAAKIAALVSLVGVALLALWRSIVNRRRRSGVLLDGVKGHRKLERLNKKMRKLERDARRNIQRIEKVQKERERTRVETVHELRRLGKITDDEVEKAFRDMY